MPIPDALITEIDEGTCVAFVGAGFSAPAVPEWSSLLETVAARGLPCDSASQVMAIARAASTPLELEMVGQILRDELADQFEVLVRDAVASDPAAASMKGRRRLLSEIPFAGILTTNFDPFLDGVAPGPDAYKRLLRPERRWWSRSVWQHGIDRQHVVKLHGDVSDLDGNQLVLARTDYRKRLYGSPDYATFLKAIFATKTVLFLGVSFTDAYLNEIRSEVLALLQPDPEHASEPFAYALMKDEGALRRHYFRSREGIEVIGYGGDMNDHSGFDVLLNEIHSRTSTVARLGEALADKRVLWLDEHPDNNEHGRRIFDQAVLAKNGAVRVDQVSSLSEAESRLSASAYDLGITSFGQPEGSAREDALSVQLLSLLRREGRRMPVLVFSRSWERSERRRLVMSLGAHDYVTEWDEFFERVVSILSA